MKKNLKIVTVIQARTQSTRLPNKVLMPLAGKTVLQRMIERVMAADLSGEIVVAITINPKDNVIQELCLKENYHCFRGHPTDLLDRHFRAASMLKADIVVKIPSDCPLIDPEVIDRVLQYYIEHQDKYDYVSNLHPATFPDGNDVEVIPIDTLRTAWKEAKKNFEREHTTPFIWENPERFRIGNVLLEDGWDYSMTERWTLDYIEDYEFIKTVYDILYEKNPIFGMDDILDLLKRRTEIRSFNEKFAGVNWYRNHLNELKTISKSQTKLIDIKQN